MIEVSSTSSFCSNPDALGTDESEKGIFDSLRNIAHLPPSPPREGDRLVDSVAGTAENLMAEEAGKEPPTASIGGCLEVVNLFFCRALANYLCIFQISRLRTSRRALRLLPELIPPCRRCHGRRWRSRSRGRLLPSWGSWAAIPLLL